MPNVLETIISAGFKRQSALQTGLAAADMFTLTQTSSEIPTPELTYEDNAGDYGKGTPFATQIYKLAAKAPMTWAARLSSENAAWLGAFAIGIPTKAAASTGFKYTSVVGSTFAALEADMPVTTVATACRPGASDVFDFALIGMACEELNLSLKTGIGRDTATISSTWVGCGKYANPSGLTLPASYTEHSLNIGGATALTLIGTNYVSTLRFLSCDFQWKNNIREQSNYVPGGGLQDGFNIMGRMRRGTPTATFRARVELVDGSPEWAAFLAQTTGTVVITILGDLIGGAVYHGLTLTLHQCQFTKHMFTSEDGLIAADLECSVQLHSSNGLLTWEATTTKDDIGTAAT